MRKLINQSSACKFIFRMLNFHGLNHKIILTTKFPRSTVWASLDKYVT